MRSLESSNRDSLQSLDAYLDSLLSMQVIASVSVEKSGKIALCTQRKKTNWDFLSTG